MPRRQDRRCHGWSNRPWRPVGRRLAGAGPRVAVCDLPAPEATPDAEPGGLKLFAAADVSRREQDDTAFDMIEGTLGIADVLEPGLWASGTTIGMPAAGYPCLHFVYPIRHRLADGNERNEAPDRPGDGLYRRRRAGWIKRQAASRDLRPRRTSSRAPDVHDAQTHGLSPAPGSCCPVSSELCVPRDETRD